MCYITFKMKKKNQKNISSMIPNTKEQYKTQQLLNNDNIDFVCENCGQSKNSDLLPNIRSQFLSEQEGPRRKNESLPLLMTKADSDNWLMTFVSL